MDKSPAVGEGFSCGGTIACQKSISEPMRCAQPHFWGHRWVLFSHPEAAAQLPHLAMPPAGPFPLGERAESPPGCGPDPGPRRRYGKITRQDLQPAASLCIRFRIRQRLAAHTPEMHRAELRSRNLRRRAACRPMAPRGVKLCLDFYNFTSKKYIFSGSGGS